MEQQDTSREQPNNIATFPKRVYLLMVYFILENFAEFGLASVLSVFMKGSLGYDEDTATTLYHVYKVIECVAPIAAAIIADSYIGRFWTMIGGSVLLEIGFFFVSISSVHSAGMTPRVLFVCGVVLLAVGGGTVRITHGAFVTDQLASCHHLNFYFSLLFYLNNLVVSAGMLLVPYLQRKIDCFGQRGCYSLPFFACGALHLGGIVLILAGKKSYSMSPPVKNIYLDFAKCILAGCKKKRVDPNVAVVGSGHWLDRAEGQVDSSLIVDVKSVLSMSLLIVPMVCYWALYDQQGSTWTFQASRMDGNVGDVDIMPSQMQSANPLIIVALLPLFQWAVFPVLHKCTHTNKCSLHKMSAGGILLSVSFFVAALLEYQVEKTYADLPGRGEAHLRVYNCLEESVVLDSFWTGPNVTLEPLSCKLFPHLPLPSETSKTVLNVAADALAISQTQITLTAEQGTSYLIRQRSGGLEVVRLHGYDTIEKDDLTRPIVQLICGWDCTRVRVSFTDTSGQASPSTLIAPPTAKTLVLSHSSRYKMDVNGVQVLKGLNLRAGGVYSILVYKSGERLAAKMFTVTQPNGVHMLWQLPQYLILTTAEIFYSIANKVFIYSQSPPRMRALTGALWVLANAFGDILVAVLVHSHSFKRQVTYFLLYGFMLQVAMWIYMWLVYRYRWRSWIVNPA